MKKTIQELILNLIIVGLASTTPVWGADDLSVTSENNQKSEPIPWSEIGAKAGADYKGDGVSVNSTDSGAVLHCVFQKLDAQATTQGLWLESTTDNQERFCVKASAVGRAQGSILSLPTGGNVQVQGKTVQYSRPWVVEEYSVSMDGVRQDFVVQEKPTGTGELVVQLEVAGAKVEPAAYGVQLTLEKSGRRVAYSRLNVTDASGKTLTAHVEAMAGTQKMAVRVDDANAVYPVRIDPTFSDANWVSLSGLAGFTGYVNSIAVMTNGTIYVGGAFMGASQTNTYNIAQWNGTSWISLGGGLNSSVTAMAAMGTNLYVGGNFLMATNTSGGVITSISVARIACWNGTKWSPVGGGIYTSPAAMLAMDTNLYVGGSPFVTNVTSTTTNVLTVNRIAKWDGSSWSALGSGVDGSVIALAGIGTNLYVGGTFLNAGGNPARRIAVWNGSAWSTLGGGFDSYLLSLGTDGSNIYAGGYFTTATNVSGTTTNSVRTSYIAKWDGTNWLAMGGGLNSAVSTIQNSGTNLYVGGYFYYATNVTATSTNSVIANYLAQWNGSNWSSVGNGVGNSVNALGVYGTNLYVGGYFSTAGSGSGSINAFRFASWDGNKWSAYGCGMNSSVSAVTEWNGKLYVAGYFSTAGGFVNNAALMSRIAQWDGTNWSPLGGGLNASAYTLAVYKSNLYVGGNFSYATNMSESATNTIIINNIAKWDGTNWSALGGAGGINGNVLSLAVMGADLYVGGSFTFAYSSSSSAYVSSIARWNGSVWSAVGGGLNSRVNAMAVSGTNLYAGGYFTQATNVSSSATNYIITYYVAQWDGSSWSSLNGGVNSYVNALATSGTNLYVGGVFTNATNISGSITSSVPTKYIAQWNGNSWSAMGGGLAYVVNSIATSGTNLYVGGYFTTATNITSITTNSIVVSNIVQWNGSNWSAIGSGVDNTISALYIQNTNLYAGGYFQLAGSKVSGYIAQVTGLDVIKPSIDGQPASSTNLAGSNAWFEVQAKGTPPLSYQWYFNSNVISDASADCLSVTTSTDTAGYYFAVISNSAGAVTSSIVQLTSISPPSVATLSASSVATATATINGTVNPNGYASGAYFQYSTDSALSSSLSTSVTTGLTGSSAQSVSQTVSSLISGTVYYYRIVSTNAGGSSYGNISNFTTLNTNALLSGLSLSVGTLSPTFVSNTISYSASVTNSVTSITVTPTVAQTNATVKVNGTTVASGSASGSISLSVGTNTILIVVTAQDGSTTKTYTISIVRLPVPTVRTLNATSIGTTAATLNGTVNPNGYSSGACFQYSTSSTLSSSVSTTTVTTGLTGSTAQSVSATLSGLASGTTYYYRLVATNAGGAVYGDISNFTTIATATVSFDSLSFTYDGTAKTVSVTTTPSGLSTAITYDGSSGAPVNAGSYTAAAVITQSGYTGGATNTMTINKAALTGTVQNEVRAYGDTNPLFSVVYSGFVNSEDSSVLSGTLAYSCVDSNAVDVATNTVVGLYAIEVTNKQTAANYSISYPDGTLTITQAVLTVTANNATRAYGQTNPIFTSTITGLMNNETTNVVQGEAALSTTATTASAVGTYTITAELGTLSATNYSFVLSNGTLTVAQGASALALEASPGLSQWGGTVTFTATAMAVEPATGTPAGTVRFLTNGIEAANVTLSSGIATYATTNLPAGTNTVVAEYAGDSNFTGSTNTVIQIVNTPPTVGTYSVVRYSNCRLLIATSNLLATASDADGDTVTLFSVDTTSTNGATLTLTGSNITYIAATTNPNVDDQFEFTVNDGRGGTATGTVTITIHDEIQGVQNIGKQTDGSMNVGLSGTPLQSYIIQATTNLFTTEWVSISTNDSDQYGNLNINDSGATNHIQRFYRAVRQ